MFLTLLFFVSWLRRRPVPPPNNSDAILDPQKQSYVQNACNGGGGGGGGPLSLPPERTLRARENIPSIDIGRLVSELFFSFAV